MKTISNFQINHKNGVFGYIQLSITRIVTQRSFSTSFLFSTI